MTAQHAATTRRPARSAFRRKLAVSVALAAAAATVAGLGTFGSFTATTSASQNVATGTVTLDSGTNTFSTSASGLVPGDTVTRTVNLANTGTQDQSAITLTTTATTSSVLDTDATNGLQLTVRSCSQAWTAGPNNTYTCSGATTVVASRAVIGSGIALPNVSALTAGSTSYLAVTLTLPTAADNGFQGKSSVIAFTFNGTQRAATTK